MSAKIHRVVSSSSHSLAMVSFCLSLAACDYTDQKQSVASFSQAVATTSSAEDSFLQIPSQRSQDAYDLCLRGAKKIKLDGTKLQSAGDACTTGDTDPQALQAAIDTVLKPIQGYAAALSAYENDSAPASVDASIDDIGQDIKSTQTSGLSAFKGITDSQIGTVGTVLKMAGEAIIEFARSRDIRRAASSMQKPLDEITSTLIDINTNLASYGTAAAEGHKVSKAVAILWPQLSYSERAEVVAIQIKDNAPVSADALNKALTALDDANKAIAASGPALSLTQVMAAVQAANAAVAAFKSSASGK